MTSFYDLYYAGPERRVANRPRRRKYDRRHRLRTESLVCDCRLCPTRRREDAEGFIEFSFLYHHTSAKSPRGPAGSHHPQTKK